MPKVGTIKFPRRKTRRSNRRLSYAKLSEAEKDSITSNWVETYNRKKTGLVVSRTPQRNYGVFTTKKWKANASICSYDGEKLNKSEVDMRYPSGGSEYLAQCHNNLYIDGVDPRLSSVARFMNCADDQHTANVEIISMTDEGCVYVFVKDSDIPKGAELFWDYGEKFDLSHLVPVYVPPESTEEKEAEEDPYRNTLYAMNHVFAMFNAVPAR